MRFTADGKPVTSFSMATSRKYKEKEETAWFRITVFGAQAESCNQYLKKGSRSSWKGVEPRHQRFAQRFIRRKTAPGAPAL